MWCRLEQNTRWGPWREMWAPTRKIGLELLYALPNRFLVAKTFGLVYCLYEQWWALGFRWWSSTGLFPTVVVVWFTSVSLMLQMPFSKFVLFSEKIRCIGRKRGKNWFLGLVIPNIDFTERNMTQNMSHIFPMSFKIFLPIFPMPF